MDLKKIEQQIGISLNDHQLMQQAFTHSSYVNEHLYEKHLDNERLEFLGDAVLELGVSQYLYTKYPHLPEGELTRIRALIVCEESLEQFSRTLQFNHYMRLGKGEEQTGGRERPSLLADIFESFLGALYLDQGYEIAFKFLEEKILATMDIDAFSHMMDYKSSLQEFIQRQEGLTIDYEIIQEKGPSHKKEFLAAVQINDKVFQGGFGHSKKEAEQRAAKEALAFFKDKHNKY